MNNKNLLSLLQSGYTTVSVRFVQANHGYRPLFSSLRNLEAAQQLNHLTAVTNSTDREYTYKCIFDDVTVGDLFMVETNSGLKLVQVSEVHEEPAIDADADFEYRWLMARIDYSQYMQILLKEDKLLKAMRDAEVAKRTANIRQHLLDGVPVEKQRSFEQALQLNDLSKSEEDKVE